MWSKVCLQPFFLLVLWVALFLCGPGFLCFESFCSWKKNFGEVLRGLTLMCLLQTIFSTWRSFSNSGHIYKHPGYKFVSVSLWPQLFPFFFFFPLLFCSLGWGRVSFRSSLFVCVVLGRMGGSSSFQHSIGKISSEILCLKEASLSFTAAIQANILRNK